MARTKNATFKGLRWTDAIPGAATFMRAIKNACGDAALIFDKLTGENGEAEIITHDGTAGRGARLRLPYVNQHFGGRSLVMTTPTAKGSNGGLNTFYLLACPIFIPPGETGFHIKVTGDFVKNEVTNVDPHVIVTTSARVEEAKVEMVEVAVPDLVHNVGDWFASVQGLTAGLHLLFVEITVDNTTTSGDVNLGRIDSWCVAPRIELEHGDSSRPGGVMQSLRDDGFSVSMRTPGATEGVGVRTYDDEYFYSEAAFHAYLTQGLNHDINGLWEYARVAPAGGNQALTLVDHNGGGTADSTNPARSRHFAHTQSLYTGEPEVAWPLLTAAFGMFGTDGKFATDCPAAGTFPTVGMLDFAAPVPVDDTPAHTIWQAPLVWPDFQTGSPTLKAAVLLGSNARTTVNNWTMNLASAVGSNTNLGAPSAIDGTNDLWLATGSALSLFNSSCPDAVDTISLNVSRGAAKPNTDEVCILGLTLYFEP